MFHVVRAYRATTLVNAASALSLLLVPNVAGAATSAPRYLAAPLAPLPAGVAWLEPTDVNNLGQIVGSATGSSRGFFLSGNQVQLLEPLADGSYSLATALNNLGQIVGRSDAMGIPKAAFWEAAGVEPEELPSSGGPDANVYAEDVNDSTQIVGYYTSSGSGNVNSWEAVRWTRDERRRFDGVDLPRPTPPPPGVFSAAFGINAEGYVVGTGSTLQANVFEAALRWTPADSVQELTAVPGITFPRFEAVAVNDREMAIGYGTNNFGVSTPVKWAADRSAVDLGQPAGAASTQPVDINNLGVIVANSLLPGNASRPMANFEGVWMDLNERLTNPSGWSLTRVTGINDQGAIVGVGTLDGATAGFLLTPVAATLAGDFNFDGAVDGTDFLFWQQENGAANSSPADANDDSLVNALDLSIWSQQFAGVSTGITPIPEPGSLSLMALAALLLVSQRSLWP